ncbi:MAG: DUF1566 domain-containing protein [Desulfuromonadales bacterium]
MSLLDEMEKKKKVLTTPKHPLNDEDLRLREVYVTGIAFILLQANETLNESKMLHLKELASAFCLSDDPAERIIANVSNLGAEIVTMLNDTIEKQDHKYLFIIDLYRAANVDGSLVSEEQKMIDIFANLLKLKPVEAEFLKAFATGKVKNDPVLMQKALLEAYHCCLDVPLHSLKYFCNTLEPVSETIVRDLAKVWIAAEQGAVGAKEEFDRHIFTDPLTGLMWTRNGNIAGKEMLRETAVKWVDNLDYAGFCDWRLPTQEEIETLKKRGGKSYAKWFKANGFSGVKVDNCWTSTTDSSNTTSSNFILNFVALKIAGELNAGVRYVWPVRGGV